MSLRKAPQLTPQLLAASRRNARRSTGPRSPAAKQNSKLNALKHGAYVSDENQRQAMQALGEDPEQFQSLTEELRSAFGPGDALWEKQIEDLAWLYWRRKRLERALTTPRPNGRCGDPHQPPNAEPPTPSPRWTGPRSAANPQSATAVASRTTPGTPRWL